MTAFAVVTRHTAFFYGSLFATGSQPHIVTIGKDLTLPVNCVLDGQQREPVSKLMGLDGAISGPLRGIFRE